MRRISAIFGAIIFLFLGARHCRGARAVVDHRLAVSICALWHFGSAGG